MRVLIPVALAVLIVAGFIVYMSSFTVRFSEQAVVTTFGQVSDGVVGALGPDVGPQPRQQHLGRVLGEGDDGVDADLADPPGAALYSYYTSGELKAEGSSITEGIGQGRITENLVGAPIDVAYRIPDEEAVKICFDLLEHEGLCMGGSTGVNIAGAIRLARELGRGCTIVTVLCDYGSRYQSKLFNPAFLKEKNLPVPEWLDATGAAS